MCSVISRESADIETHMRRTYEIAFNQLIIYGFLSDELIKSLYANG